MTRWLRWSVLGAIVIVSTAFRFAEAPVRDHAVLLADTRAALERAGFRVTPRLRPPARSGRAGAPYLIARHPACAGDISVSTTAAVNPPADDGTEALYVYGGWQGRAPAALATLGAYAAMQGHYLLSLGDAPKPHLRMLVVTDPSACLALTGVDWPAIWYGTGGHRSS